MLEVTKKNSQIQTYRYFQWDDSGKPVGMVIKEKNGSGAWQTKPYYFWTNQRGDVTAIVDSSGTQVGSYTYDAFGNERSETGDIAKSNPIRYAGYYYDTETKHDYLKARYYDPQNGNFLALDPHPGDDDDPLSQNGYTYAGNNPVMEIDPDGDLGINISSLIKLAKITGKVATKAWKYVAKYTKKLLKKASFRIVKVGRIKSTDNKDIKGYWGYIYSYKRKGKTIYRSIEFHPPHQGHKYHIQSNKYSKHRGKWFRGSSVWRKEFKK